MKKIFSLSSCDKEKGDNEDYFRIIGLPIRPVMEKQGRPGRQNQGPSIGH